MSGLVGQGVSIRVFIRNRHSGAETLRTLSKRFSDEAMPQKRFYKCHKDENGFKTSRALDEHHYYVPVKSTSTKSKIWCSKIVD